MSKELKNKKIKGRENRVEERNMDILVEAGKKSFLFEPQDDITPLEAVRCTQAFVLGMTARRSWGFMLDDLKIRRHFTEVDVEEG